jgi:PAS domain S-box-containing protein
MNFSLKTKVSAFIAAVVVTVSAVNTAYFILTQKRSIERELIARGAALSEALSRTVDEGLAAENLNLIKSVEETIHTDDVVFTQVFSILWLAVASVPSDRFNAPPAPEAVRYFAGKRQPYDCFADKQPGWIDIYHPVNYDPHDAGFKKIHIGYVRLRISSEPVKRAMTQAVLGGLLTAVALTTFSVVALNALMRKYVLTPILTLHRSMQKYKEAGIFEAVPVRANDEVGDLSSEFNQMSRALKEREEKLAEEKERLSVTLRSIGDGVIVTGVDATITLMNHVAEQNTGWAASEASGRKLEEVFAIVNELTGERCEHPVEKVIKTGATCGLANSTALIRKDGTRIIIEDSAAPIRDRDGVIIGVVLVFRDVTEKRRLEEEVIKAEKLQSVGILAGGLAHDFNNLLTSIVGNISMARKHIDTRSKAHERLTEAETASRRATDLTYQLLTFARGGAPVRTAASIADIIRESSSFALSGTKVAPEFAIAGDIFNVDVDPGQMSQVFNNLIINAVQAMPGGGTIRFKAENKIIQEKEISTLPGGACVHVSVHDTGAGIAPEHLFRIFEPYFTTKEKGSGLGLASVYSIIKRHEGHISVESKPGRGTTFDIYLPASLQPAADHEAEEEMIAGGQGKVLLMDDEKSIRDVAGEILKELGYRVEFARGGAEAIELYKKALALNDPYAAVIMDLTVPGGMGGKEAIEKLLAIDPHIKAIVSSGYSNDPILSDFSRYGFSGVITKPYSLGSFSKSLQKVIKKE